MHEMSSELAFLESVTETYVTSESSQDRLIKSLAMRVFSPLVPHGGTALEFGCSDGFVTSLISPMVSRVVVVDGSTTFLDRTRKRGLPNVELVHSLFEEYDTAERFDCIFATYVLEHVNDDVALLAKAKTLLKPNGLLFVVVPNARALSRQLARHMGLIQDLYALTENDQKHGHRRVYDRVLLNTSINAAGLRQVAQGGLLLKLLADFQMDQLIDSGVLGKAQCDGLFKMGLEYPDLAGSLWAVCAS